MFTQDQIDKFMPSKDVSELIVQNLEMLIKKDQKVSYVYMVTRGTIVEKDGDSESKVPKFKHKRGDILGL